MNKKKIEKIEKFKMKYDKRGVCTNFDEWADWWLQQSWKHRFWYWWAGIDSEIKMLIVKIKGINRTK